MSYSGLVLCEELDVTREPLKQTHIFVNNLFKIPNISHIEKFNLKQILFSVQTMKLISLKLQIKVNYCFHPLFFIPRYLVYSLNIGKQKQNKKHLNCLLTKSGITRS